jgi:hypothetical protein
MPEPTLKFVSKAPAAEVIAILLNVSYALKIDDATVVRIFRGEEPVDKWDVLMDEFFSGCPLELIKDFMGENGFTPEDLKHVYFQLPGSRQSKRFMKVLANGQLE